jgi:two-component system, OmpR family, response regulator
MAHAFPCKDKLRAWTERRIRIGNARLRVLVVDDNSNSAHALVAYLSIEDIEYAIALGGREAIASTMMHDPHVILMDISMPECTGYDAARALRHHPRTREVVIFAHTALDEAEVRRHQDDSEFDGYLQKGYSPRRIVMLLAALTRRAP